MKICVCIYDRCRSITNIMLTDLLNDPEVSAEYVIRYPYPRMRIMEKVVKAVYRIGWHFRKWHLAHTLQWSGVDLLVVTNEAMLGFSKKDLRNLKKVQNIKLAALLIDPIKAKYRTAAIANELLPEFDYVLTFDPKDAEEFGFIYTNQLYSSVDMHSTRLEKDLFYIGNIKNRSKLLNALANLAQENRVKVEILLTGNVDDELKSKAGVSALKKSIPYKEMLKMMQQCRCILDITQEMQSGITLRYYEAVVYNKKLLSNNPNIKSLPFYNDRYMKIYHQIEDIDWKWICNGDMPNYCYHDEFSSKHLKSLLEKTVSIQAES